MIKYIRRPADETGLIRVGDELRGVNGLRTELLAERILQRGVEAGAVDAAALATACVSFNT